MDSLSFGHQQAGLGRGNTAVQLFKPGADVIKGFTAEMPIDAYA